MPEKITSHPTTPAYREGWNRAFGRSKPFNLSADESLLWDIFGGNDSDFEGEMSKYTHRPVIVNAVQWFKDGDSPDVIMFVPFIPHLDKCRICGHLIIEHGCTQRSSDLVCPGDWVITHPEPDDVFVYHEDEFMRLFEAVTPQTCLSQEQTRKTDA